MELADMSQPLVDACSLRPSHRSVPASSSYSSSKQPSPSSIQSSLQPLPRPSPNPPSSQPLPRSPSASRHSQCRHLPASKCVISLLPETCIVLLHFPAHWGLQSLPAVQGLFAAFFLWTSGCSTLCESYPEIQFQDDSDDGALSPRPAGDWPPIIWRASHLRWSWADRAQEELSSSLGIGRLFESGPWHFYDAFTHASPAKFITFSQRVQRLEFLGDAVFTLASTIWMGISDPASLLLPATSFIALRSKLLSNTRLHQAATVFGLHRLLRRRLEAREGVDFAVSPKNVSDSVEAMLGAVWCSGGINTALHVAINMLVKVAGLANDSKLQKLATTPDKVDSCDFVRELSRNVVATAAAVAADHVIPCATFKSITTMAKTHLSFSLVSLPSSPLSPPESPPRTTASALPLRAKSFAKLEPLQLHDELSPSHAERLLHMCTIDESCTHDFSTTVLDCEGEGESISDARACSNVFLACLGKAVMDVVVSGHAFVMLGGAKPADLHSWVRVEVLRHERLVDLAVQHNIGPDVVFNAPGISWDTIVSTPFGKRSVGGSALCASVGCVWLLDVAGYNKLASPQAQISAPITFRRREITGGGDELGAAVSDGGPHLGKG